MNKKGFTLMELLAVIVILGLLSVLIVPKVVSSIKDSKKKSYEVSVNNLVDALNSMAIDKKATLTPFNGCSYNFDSSLNTCTDLEFSGMLPDSGSVSVDSDGNVNGVVEYGDYEFDVIQNNVMNFPTEYIRVEYIESDGNQYINTNIIPNNEMGVYLKVSSSDVIHDLIYFGSKGNGLTRFWIGNVSSQLYYGWNGLTDAQNRPAILVNTINEIKMNYFNDRKNILNDQMIEQNLDVLVSNDYTITVFAGNNQGTASYKSKIKLYDLKVSQGGKIVNSFIPCYRKSDDVAGLYDIIEGVFYTNSGTDEFVIGE